MVDSFMLWGFGVAIGKFTFNIVGLLHTPHPNISVSLITDIYVDTWKSK
jgi:hypothetical protein